MDLNRLNLNPAPAAGKNLTFFMMFVNQKMKIELERSLNF